MYWVEYHWSKISAVAGVEKVAFATGPINRKKI